MNSSNKKLDFALNEQLYFRDINRYQVLTESREKEVIARIKDGEKAALNVLLTCNLRFVVSIARKYQNKGLSLLELINEGNLGLYKAAKKFNGDKGVRFISYAVWWIRQSIQKALFDQANNIKVPPNKIALYNRFKVAMAKLGDFEKAMDLPEFAEAREEIVSVIGKLSAISLSSPVQKDDGEGDSVNSLVDTIGVKPNQEEESERHELRTVIDNLLSLMTDKEETVLRMYYGIGCLKEYTLDEIGQELKLTKERVRQIKNRALRKLLRNKKYKDNLSPFVSHQISD